MIRSAIGRIILPMAGAFCAAAIITTPGEVKAFESRVSAIECRVVESCSSLSVAACQGDTNGFVNGTRHATTTEGVITPVGAISRRTGIAGSELYRMYAFCPIPTNTSMMQTTINTVNVAGFQVHLRHSFTDLPQSL